MLILVRFNIKGSLRFLSHSETLRLFHRACIRAGMPLQYSQGFNPHPKISLPCPRSVGIEAEDEVLIIKLSLQKLEYSRDKFILQMKHALSRQLPRGCEIISVISENEKMTFRPREVVYLIKVKKQFIDDSLRTRLNTVLKEEHLTVNRYRNTKRQEYKEVDLRPFMKSIDYVDKDNGSLNINIKCNVTDKGTVRVEEILNLFNLDIENLSAPVQRTSVKWN
ncbi:MAG: TIGR03936 family radical SAM-associated protein [Planctomycetota bacterium]